MSTSSVTSKPKSILRQRILTFVCALIVISLAGSVLTLYRITEVNRVLDGINRVSVPLGRMLAQMQSDSEIFRRELDRSMGFSHWSDLHWKPRSSPRWIEDVITHEHARVSELVGIDSQWAAPEARKRWQEWAQSTSKTFEQLKGDSAALYEALSGAEAARESDAAHRAYSQWNTRLDEWMRVLQWGAAEYEHSLRQTFNIAQNRVSELRTGLELILVVVICLSFLLLWLGERALRPLGELTRLAREITRRGLRREDKAILPHLILSRGDEVSALAREFHGMATALLEREKTVELQKHRVEEQNKLLREIGALNENILKSIESVLIVADLSGRITQCNPLAARWLGVESAQIIGSELLSWPKIQVFLPEFTRLSKLAELTATRIEAKSLGERVYGGHLMPLKHDGVPSGAILVLEDLTEEKSLEHRLRIAENLAAVGRMSAQVAHEVRNPLHSLGLEAELALEQALAIGSPPLKQSLYSILGAVDRLEKITENYLKLSRLSAGKKTAVDLGETLETVLATYASTCEAQGVRIDWRRETGSSLVIRGDGDLLEQVFGNLLRNALQALETGPQERPQWHPTIRWTMGTLENNRVWIRIQDNGPGLAAEVRERLFTPFVTTRAQGTGLGLSFVKQVIEDHAGTIECVEAGEGACFEIRVPALAAADKNFEVNGHAENPVG